MYSYRPTDREHIHIYGRTVMQDPLPLFWTASGLEFATDSAECYLDVACQYSLKEQYLRVEMDGFCIQRFMVMQGRHEYCLFRDFTGGEIKRIDVRLEVQPMDDDSNRRLLIYGLRSDRPFQPVPEKKLRLEFIGDSLTSGEGLTGTPGQMEWCAGIFGLNGHYALETAAHFDADYSIVSQSGWGICCGWDNNVNTVMPKIYDKVCAPAVGPLNEVAGAGRNHDFAAWQPDAVIVNLATNDSVAADNPPWTDPETGIAYKQYHGENSILDEASESNFVDSAVDFLFTIRNNNPKAYIIWAYGMCDHVMEPYIEKALKKYKEKSGDERAEYLSLPSVKEGQFGAHAHPGPTVHHEAARTIIDRLEELNVTGIK